MPISVLSQETIDKIAAGEVVERPASIVKELTENAIDAGAGAVTVEIREGGISMIRVTDNGGGIAPEEVRTAFLRHATSKIRSVEDLETVATLGFRGEALSSIAAVSQVELITKTPGSLMGVRYQIEGGAEISLEEVGAPEGTTILVRNLFYNTPARRKFLKSAQTEAGYIGDLMERLAMSHPEVSFKFINQGQMKLHTSGNGKLKDIVYHIHGRDIAANLLEVSADCGTFSLSGYIGKPGISRGNRGHENYFVNGRYVKSNVISRAIEEAYKPFLMNHRYPFTILSMQIDGTRMDANVHPAKLEVRFSDQIGVYEEICRVVRDTLAGKELIPEISFKTNRDIQEEKQNRAEDLKRADVPEPFEKKRLEEPANDLAERLQTLAAAGSAHESRTAYRGGALKAVGGSIVNGVTQQPRAAGPADHPSVSGQQAAANVPAENGAAVTTQENAYPDGKPVQMELFDEKLLSPESRKRHKLIGQLFDTFWLVEFSDKLYIIDQHAAHEKVLYERFMKQFAEKTQTSQQLSPPLILSLSLSEEEQLKQYLPVFTDLGYVIEPFGGREYAVSAVPGNLYSLNEKDLFVEMLDGLADVSEKAAPETIHDRVATMACKAAVKGGNRLSSAEADALIGELLELENPYNCPHGRPTIVSMTHYELDRKFKRIL